MSRKHRISPKPKPSAARDLHDRFKNVDAITESQDGRRALEFVEHHRAKVIETVYGFVAPHDSKTWRPTNRARLEETADHVSSQATRWLLMRDAASEPRSLKRWLDTDGKDEAARFLWPEMSPRSVFSAIKIWRAFEEPGNRESLRELARGKVAFDKVMMIRDTCDSFSREPNATTPAPRMSLPRGMSLETFSRLEAEIEHLTEDLDPLGRDIVDSTMTILSLTTAELADRHGVSVSTVERRRRSILNEFKPLLTKYGW